jgi:hypothetical protein
LVGGILRSSSQDVAIAPIAISGLQLKERLQEGIDYILGCTVCSANAELPWSALGGGMSGNRSTIVIVHQIRNAPGGGLCPVWWRFQAPTSRSANFSVKSLDVGPRVGGLHPSSIRRSPEPTLVPTPQRAICSAFTNCRAATELEWARYRKLTARHIPNL